MTKIIAAIVVILTSLTAVHAEDISVSTGLYAQEDYVAPYVCVAAEGFMLYHEHDVAGSDYDLTIAKIAVGDGLKAVVRRDDNLWLRPGLQFGLGGGSTKTQVLVLAGVGNAPTWVDVFTPAVPLAEGLALTGHLRFKEGGSNDYWVGPSFTHGRFGAWYHHNLRFEGSWEGGIDYQLSW